MKKRKRLILSCLLALLCTGMAQAEDVTAYAYVQNSSGATVTADGTASFTASEITLAFDNGNAVMKIGDNTVAKLTSTEVTNGGQLCADYTTSAGSGSLSVTVSDAGLATLYSPFVLTVPATVQVYAPTYNGGALICNSDTKIAENRVVPAGTPLLLRGAGTYSFGLSATASTATISANALSGTALPLTVEASSVLTLGKKSGSTNTYGFYTFTGTEIPASKAYLDPNVTSLGAKDGIAFDFGELTAIDNVNANVDDNKNKEGKFLIKGRVVILKGGKMYNLNGQEVK